MSIFRVIDGNIIPEAEYRARKNELVDFVHARSAGHAKRAFSLSLGRELAPTKEAAGAFVPIGKHLPLTIMICEVYTGKYPERGLFGGDGDVAVVSGLKSYEVFNASTRALNFLVKNVDSYKHLHRPDAFHEGTSLVAYSPAVLSDSLTISFEIAVADFPVSFINSLTSAFTTLAGIPLLLPYTGYLLGAGQLLKLAGDVGHAFFDGIKFSVTDTIDIDMPGTPPVLSGFRIISASDELGAGCTYTKGVGVVDEDGKPYAGALPYIVISLDGRQRDELNTFAPTVASAAVLQRFFQVPDGGQVAIDTIVQGLQLASDFKYREQAIKLQEKLAKPDLDPPTRQQLTSQLDATLKNILSDALRPKQI
jgi:hypothetical protein